MKVVVYDHLQEDVKHIREEVFMKEQGFENEFDDKDYEREYPFIRFALDFAWVHKKKVIEIDGEQHERFEEYKLRDKEKDRLCDAWGKDTYNCNYCNAEFSELTIEHLPSINKKDWKEVKRYISSLITSETGAESKFRFSNKRKIY